MSNCKEGNICMESIDSKCIEVNSELGNNTKITSNCVNQEMVNEDLYVITDDIISDLDTSELGNLSIAFPTVNEKIPFKEVIKKYEEEIDNLKTEINNLKNINYCNIDITSCGISFGPLVDDCGEPATTLGDVLKILFNQHNQ